MKKIAVVFEGDIYNRFGGTNSIQNRIEHLRQCAGYGIDPYMIQVYDGKVMRLLRKSGGTPSRPARARLGSVECDMRWFKRSWTDAVVHRWLGQEPPMLMSFTSRVAHELEGYDLISAHDRIGGLAAMRASQLYGMPFFMTWHGYSIHTDPFRDAVVMNQTRRLLLAATDNFFVSKSLAEVAQEIAPGSSGRVLFNGVSQRFHRYSDQSRAELRRKLGVDGCKVVAFVARFDPIKNAESLPDIYSRIQRYYEGKVAFWAIGDGCTKAGVERQMTVPCRFWGYQEPELIPDFMNCIDVLVLPSRREGLPLVSLEAIKCGAGVVASSGVGASEYIGSNNVFDITAPDFAEHISRRAVAMLNGDVPAQTLNKDMTWAETAQLENAIYASHLSR